MLHVESCIPYFLSYVMDFCIKPYVILMILLRSNEDGPSTGKLFVY